MQNLSEKNLNPKLTKETIIEIKNESKITKISSNLKSKNQLKILKLCNGENSIVKIAERLGMKVPNVSKYIKELKEEGLIEYDSFAPKRIINKIIINLKELD